MLEKMLFVNDYIRETYKGLLGVHCVTALDLLLTTCLKEVYGKQLSKVASVIVVMISLSIKYN